MSTHTPVPPAPTQAGGARPRRRWWWLIAVAFLVVVVVVIGALYYAMNPPLPSCTTAADPSRSGAISQYCPSGVEPGSALTVAHDGAVWFGTQKVARLMPQTGAVSTFAVVTSPYAIAQSGLAPTGGSDVWFIANDKVGRVTASGQVTAYALPSDLGLARAIIAGSDGNLWVMMDSKLVRVPTTGATAGVPVRIGWPTGNEAAGLGWGVFSTWGAAPDGSLWVATSGGVTRITPDGSITQISLDVPGGINALTGGPDGASMWFIAGNGRAGRITLSGAISYFGSASIGQGDNLTGIAVGPDGNLWYSTQNGALGRVTPSGVVTKYTVPSATSITCLTGGPDGVWFLALYARGGFQSPLVRVTRITP